MSNFTPVPFAISHEQGYSSKENHSTLINVYTKVSPTGSKNKYILMNTEGAEEILTAPSPILGMYEFKKITYIVTADKLYKVSEHNDWIVVGDVSFTKGVSFADNGIDMMMVAENGYAFNPETSVITDMSTQNGWYPADTVAYMDGYFIFNRTETGQFFISKLYSLELDPIDWATGESAPDDTLAVFVANRILWLIGTKSCEAWYNSGNPSFPFTRINSAIVEIGCRDYRSVAKIRNDIFMVGNDYKVYQSQGYQFKAISNPAIEKEIQANDRILNAFTYNNNGSFFYVLAIGNKFTFVYDVSTGLWHRRLSCNKPYWKILGAFNKEEDNILIGYSVNVMHKLSTDILTENGDNIRREVVTLPIHSNMNRFRVHEVVLDCEVAQADKDIEVALQTSNDGGKSWGNDNIAYLGARGQRTQKVRWSKLGQFRDLTFKIVIYEPTDIRLINLLARMD